MAINRVDITVPDVNSLRNVHVAELLDGCFAYVVKGDAYYVLVKACGMADDGSSVVVPRLGSPRAGAALACWRIVLSAANAALGMISVQTLAELGALEGPAATTDAWVDETDAAYRFFPGDTTPANGWTVIANTGGTDGRWKLVGGDVSLGSLGNGADDWPRLFGPGGAVPTMDGKVDIALRPELFLSKSLFANSMPSNTKISASPATRVVSTNPTTGTGTLGLFDAQPTFTNVVNTTLAANTLPGASFIDTVASVPVGSIVQLRSGAGTGTFAQYYTVRDVFGAGPFTLTLDRVVLHQYAIGDTVRTATHPTGIKIFGNGMTISGTGDRGIIITGGLNCTVDDVHFDEKDGVFGAFKGQDIVFGLGGRGNIVSNCDGFGRILSPPDSANQFVFIESNEGTDVHRCNANEFGDTGFLVVSSFWCDTVECNVYNTFQGITFGVFGVLDLGCTDCSASECYIQNSDILVSASTRITVSSCGGVNNTIDLFDSSGITIESCNVGGGAGLHCERLTATRISNVRIASAGGGLLLFECDDTLVENFEAEVRGTGISIESATNTRMTNVSVKPAANAFGAASIESSDGFDAVNVAVIGTTGISLDPLLSPGDGKNVRIQNYQFTGDPTRVSTGVLSANYPGRVVVDNATMTLQFAGSIGYSQAGAVGVMLLGGNQEITETVAGCFGFFQDATAGKTLRRMSGRYLFNVTTPITIAPGNFSNIGNVTLDVGGLTVFYPFPDVTDLDHVNLSRLISGGVPGAPPVFSILAGLQVNVQGVAGDTSVYEIQIDA